MTAPPTIGIVLGSTRTGRFADRPAQWLFELASRRADAAYELVDLRDYPLPFFDEPKSPLREPPAIAARWREKVAALDAYIFVTGEYNHGIPAVLKNALDYVYPEWGRKPASYVGYGNAGGARAIEQLRMNLVELHVVPLRNAVHVQRDDYFAMVMHGKTFADFPQYVPHATLMLDDVLWWARALRTARATAA